MSYYYFTQGKILSHLLRWTEENNAQRALKFVVLFLGMICTTFYRHLCLWFAGTSSQGHRFDLQMAQAGFSSHLVKVSMVFCFGERR